MKLELRKNVENCVLYKITRKGKLKGAGVSGHESEIVVCMKERQKRINECEKWLAGHSGYDKPADWTLEAVRKGYSAEDYKYKMLVSGGNRYNLNECANALRKTAKFDK